MPTIYVSLSGAAGYMGRTHLAKILKLQDAGKTELVAVCDPKFADPAYRRSIPDVKHYSDFSDMISLDVPKPHLVVIASPTQYHATQSLRALVPSRVSSVLCEKPMAENSKEAEEVRRACSIAGRPWMAAFVEYFNPAFRYAQRLILEEIGKISEMEVTRMRPPLERGRKPGTKNSSGVGFDCGVHDVANLLMLHARPGTNAISIHGSSREVKINPQNPSKDLFTGEFDFELRNASHMVSFRVKMIDSFVAEERRRSTKYVGDAGVVSVDYVRNYVMLNKDGKSVTERPKGDSLENMYDAALAQVLDEAEYPVPIGVSLGSVRIMEGIRPALSEETKAVGLTLELFI